MDKNINELYANPINKTIYGDEIISEDFIDNIKKNGVMVPLVIKSNGTIISGHRRWTAAKLLNLLTVPISIKNFNDELDEKQAVIDFNKQREKTFTQMMNEGEAIEEIEEEKAEKRRLSNLKQNAEVQMFAPREERQGERYDLEIKHACCICGREVKMTDVTEKYRLGYCDICDKTSFFEKEDNLVETFPPIEEQLGKIQAVKEMFPELLTGKTRDIVAKKIGIGSGFQYEKAKLIIKKADKKTIENLDSGEITINQAYQQARGIAIETETPIKNVNKPHVIHNSGENEWYTPKEYIESARKVMSCIDLDPASSLIANKTVNAEKIYTIDDNGLDKKWNGNVWLNPPYSGDLVGKFAEKLKASFENKDINQAVVMVNNATETQWFNNMISVASAVVFPKTRIKFIDVNGNQGNSPLQGQCFIYIGDKRERFLEVFKIHGWGASL